jgi:hypothetical protein
LEPSYLQLDFFIHEVESFHETSNLFKIRISLRDGRFGSWLQELKEGPRANPQIVAVHLNMNRV